MGKPKAPKGHARAPKAAPETKHEFVSPKFRDRAIKGVSEIAKRPFEAITPKQMDATHKVFRRYVTENPDALPRGEIKAHLDLSRHIDKMIQNIDSGPNESDLIRLVDKTRKANLDETAALQFALNATLEPHLSEKLRDHGKLFRSIAETSRTQPISHEAAEAVAWAIGDIMSHSLSESALKSLPASDFIKIKKAAALRENLQGRELSQSELDAFNEAASALHAHMDKAISHANDFEKIRYSKMLSGLLGDIGKAKAKRLAEIVTEHSLMVEKEGMIVKEIHKEELGQIEKTLDKLLGLNRKSVPSTG